MPPIIITVGVVVVIVGVVVVVIVVVVVMSSAVEPSVCVDSSVDVACSDVVVVVVVGVVVVSDVDIDEVEEEEEEEEGASCTPARHEEEEEEPSSLSSSEVRERKASAMLASTSTTVLLLSVLSLVPASTVKGVDVGVVVVDVDCANPLLWLLLLSYNGDRRGKPNKPSSLPPPPLAKRADSIEKKLFERGGRVDDAVASCLSLAGGALYLNGAQGKVAVWPPCAAGYLRSSALVRDKQQN